MQGKDRLQKPLHADFHVACAMIDPKRIHLRNDHIGGAPGLPILLART